MDELIKKYINNNRDKAYALVNYLNIKNKSFKLKDALTAIIKVVGNNENSISNVINILTKQQKKSTFGRSQVSGSEPSVQNNVDLIQNGDNVELSGYKSDNVYTPNTPNVNTNPSKYKNSGEKKKLYTDTVTKINDLGSVVKKLYPGANSQDITNMLAHIKQYCVINKVGIYKIIDLLNANKIKIVKSDRGHFTIIKNIGEGRIVIFKDLSLIFESINDVNTEVTFQAFKTNIKRFLAQLLQNPTDISISPIFLSHNINKTKLIQLLIDNNIVIKEEKINDKDENGEPKTATMNIKYSVPKYDFDKKLHTLFTTMFEKTNSIDTNIEEEGGFGGATSANVSAAGSFVQPVFAIQRRKIN